MLKYILIFLFISSFATPIRSNRMLDNINLHKDLTEYSKVALYVIHHFIGPKTNTLIIMEGSNRSYEGQQMYHKRLLDNIIKNLNESLSIQLFFSQPDDRPWDYNLFIVDSWHAFEALCFRMPITKHERDYYLFIMLTHVTKQQMHRTLNKIFRLCISLSVKNVVVMTKSKGNNFISFYTYKIFAPDGCHRTFTRDEVNRYENGKLQKESLFLKTLTNLHSCPLTVTVNIMEPLLTYDGNPNQLLDAKHLGGIEGKLIKLMAETLNFKINLRISNESNEIGLSAKSSGCFRDLEENKAQIAIGGLSTAIPYNSKFTKTFAYHTTPYVFVVRGGVFFGPMKQLMNPLNKTTWIFLGLHLILAMIFIQIIERYKNKTVRNFVFGPKNKYPMRNMITIYLGNPVPVQILPKRNFARFIMMTWLFLTFEIRNGYQGKMFDSLRLSKRIPVPDKFSELLDMDYTLLSSSHRTFYPQNKTNIMRRKILRFKRIQASESRFITTSILDYLADYNFKNYNTSTLTYVEEKIYSYQCVMYLNKHSILRESIDRKLKLFMSSGIVSHIAKGHVSPYFYNKNPRPHYVPKITQRNLQGLYYLYGILCEICIFTFILELLTRKSKRLLKIMDWFN